MYTVIGVIGAVLILFGFYRTSVGRWTGKSFWYEMDNLIGALLLIVYQVHLKVWVSIVFNIVWAIVAIRGLSSYNERKK